MEYPQRKYISTSRGYVVLDETRERRHNQKRSSNVLTTPKRYILAMLLLMMGIAQINSGAYAGLINVGAAVIIAALLDTLIAWKRKRKLTFPDGAVITGLIVALVLSPMVSWYVSGATAAIAIVSKHLFKIKKKPVFNPAAFGLLITTVLFSSGQSWWGGLSMLPAWCIVFLLITGFLVTQKVNKFPQVFAFLGVYFLLLLIMGVAKLGGSGDMMRIPYINSALFLAFFMLTDPPTSPGKYKDQILFGSITALASVAAYMLFGGLVFLLVGVLTANGWKAWKTFNNKNASSISSFLKQFTKSSKRRSTTR